MGQTFSTDGIGWLGKVTTALKSIIRFLFWLVLLTVVVRILWSWTFAGESYSILPFTSTAQQEGSDLGRAVSELVSFELQHISEIHDPEKNPWSFRGESLPKTHFMGTQAFQNVGTVSAVGMQIPVGEVLIALKRTWPHFGARSTISGSVRSRGGVL